MNDTTPKARARILLGLDGFGPVTIEDWRSLGPSVARALITATDDIDWLTDEVKRLSDDIDVISVGRADAVIEIDRLTAELEEARTELANERGEGDPPSPGWIRNDFDRGVISWTLYLDADLNPVDAPDGVTERWVLWAILTRANGNIEWSVDECDEGMTVMRGEASSLRSAMRAASAAIRGTT